jgi:hypothetical protein
LNAKNAKIAKEGEKERARRGVVPAAWNGEVFGVVVLRACGRDPGDVPGGGLAILGFCCWRVYIALAFLFFLRGSWNPKFGMPAFARLG